MTEQTMAPGATIATRWDRVLIASLGGVATACMVGKATAGLPDLRAEGVVDVSEAGVLVSLVSVLIAAGALIVGLRVDRIGARRAAILSLLLMGLASLAGAAAPSGEWLLLGRAVEAVGFLFAIIALATLVTVSAAPADRPLAMAIWSAWMPAGVAFMLFVGAGAGEAIGWRGFWILAGLAAIGCALGVALLFEPPARAAPRKEIVSPWAIVLSRNGLLHAVTFALYAAQFSALFSFLPLVIIDQTGASREVALIVGAVGAALNVGGNILAGALLRRGVDRRLLLVTCFATMALSALVILDPDADIAAKGAAAILWASIAGGPPATLWGGAGVIARRPADAPIASGLLMQGAGAGQLLGPIIFAAMVERPGAEGGADWGQGAAFAVGAAVLCIGLALIRPTRR